MASFHKIYSKFKAALQDGWQTGEVVSHFGPTASLESMFRYLVMLQEAQQILLPPLGDKRINRKGSVEAGKFRNEGNRFYKEKKLEKALLAYNYSILAAPHPPLSHSSNCATGDEYGVLALGYANRSALLYETEQYEPALADIDRAIAFGYPASRRHRLHERRAKCLLALGRTQEACKGLEDAIGLLATSSLEEKEILSTKDSMTKLLAKCDNTNAHMETITGSYEKIYYTGPLSPPEITSPQENIPYISSCLKIAYTPARGRHLIADREIQPGEILIVEDAQHAVVKLGATLRTHCSNCLRRAPIPIPCPTCSLVVFCCDRCRDVGLSGGHGVECEALAAMVALQLDPAHALAMRVLSSMSLTTLRNQVAAIRRTTGSSSGSKPFLQVSHDYRSLYNLEGHITARPEHQLQETAASAYILTNILLEKCPKFLKGENGCSITPTQDDVILVGSQLMHLILGIECNVHSTKEAQISNDNKAVMERKDRGKEIGWAVYSALSLLNHSCIPNSLTTSLGSTKFLYSISIIPKGVEITDSYGERYVSHSRSERRKALQDHYFFCCGCAACQSDWPVYEELPEKPSLRCPSCCQVLVGFQCMICKLACTSENALKNGIRLYDAPKTQVQISRTWSEYSKVADQIHMGKLNANLLSKVLEMLTLLDKYSVHPNKAYISTQETLMTCFDLMGSVVFGETSGTVT